MKTTCTFHPTHITGNQITPVKPQRYSTEFVFYPPSTVGLKFKDEVTGQKFDQSFHSVPTKQGHSRWVYVFRMFSLKSVEWIPGALTLFKMVNRSFTRKILMQDYQMLKGQTDRLKVGANAMNCPVAADLLNKVYRNWWRLAIKKKPYFQGYSATGDLEDLCSE